MILRVVVHASVIVFFSLSVKWAVLDLQPNLCQMSYMSPNYFPVQFRHSSPRYLHKYSLFRYIEGSGQDLMSRAQEFNGAPVIFVPGNAGSHKQVRSLAANAADMFARSQGLFSRNLDFFTIETEEELSVFDGNILFQQTDFLNHCLQEIVQKYKDPVSVVVIGHSMGGLVARGVLTLPDYAPSSVSTIITLNSPHIRPPVLTEKSVSTFTNRVNNFWSDPGNRDLLKDVVLVSLGGGYRDILIREDLTSIFHVVNASNGFSVGTTSIPGVWLTVDHMCVCWCRQLMIVINQALLSLVNLPAGQLASTPARLNVMRRFFLSRLPIAMDMTPPPALSQLPPVELEPEETSLSELSEWANDKLADGERNENVRVSGLLGVSSYRWSIAGQDSKAFLLLTDLVPNREFRVIDASDKWYDITHEVVPLPPPSTPMAAGTPKSMMRIPASSLKGKQLVLVFSPSVVNSRRVLVVAQWIDRKFPAADTDTRMVRPRGSALAEFVLPSFFAKYFPLMLFVRTHQCDAGEKEHFPPLIYSYQPTDTGMFEETLTSAVDVTTTATTTTTAAAPATPTPSPSPPPSVVPLAPPVFRSALVRVRSHHLVSAGYEPRVMAFLDPVCEYSAIMQPDIVGFGGQLLRTHVDVILPIMVAVLLSALSIQSRVWGASGLFPSVLSALHIFPPASTVLSISASVLLPSTPVFSLLPPWLRELFITPHYEQWRVDMSAGVVFVCVMSWSMAVALCILSHLLPWLVGFLLKPVRETLRKSLKSTLLKAAIWLVLFASLVIHPAVALAVCLVSLLCSLGVQMHMPIPRRDQSLRDAHSSHLRLLHTLFVMELLVGGSLCPSLVVFVQGLAVEPFQFRFHTSYIAAVPLVVQTALVLTLHKAHALPSPRVSKSFSRVCVAGAWYTTVHAWTHFYRLQYAVGVIFALFALLSMLHELSRPAHLPKRLLKQQ